LGTGPADQHSEEFGSPYSVTHKLIRVEAEVVDLAETWCR
jgi:hypothetical protein